MLLRELGITRVADVHTTGPLTTRYTLVFVLHIPRCVGLRWLASIRLRWCGVRTARG